MDSLFFAFSTAVFVRPWVVNIGMIVAIPFVRNPHPLAFLPTRPSSFALAIPIEIVLVPECGLIDWMNSDLLSDGMRLRGFHVLITIAYRPSHTKVVLNSFWLIKRSFRFHPLPSVLSEYFHGYHAFALWADGGVRCVVVKRHVFEYAWDHASGEPLSRT